jgi:hypothetical protein
VREHPSQDTPGDFLPPARRPSIERNPKPVDRLHHDLQLINVDLDARRGVALSVERNPGKRVLSGCVIEWMRPEYDSQVCARLTDRAKLFGTDGFDVHPVRTPDGRRFGDGRRGDPS